MQLALFSFIIGLNGYCLSLENKVVSFRIKQVSYQIVVKQVDVPLGME